ncbi:hypothetical protein M0R72_15565 [Candidatus Pacearchaeota archaeon]|jgi:hypothetical protein|nr:hypothetical protein [Candidatus Pacearchaeota archaeon]
MISNPFIRCWAPEGDDGGGAGGSGNDGGGTGDGKPQNQDKNPNAGGAGGGKQEEKTISMTQVEFDTTIQKRIDRAQKKWKEDTEAEAKKAAMSEAEKLKAEKDEADKKVADTLSSANKIKVEAKAEVALLAAGVKSERLDKALRLLDLGDVAIGDDGKPDMTAINAAVSALVKDFPEIIGSSAGPGKGGGDFSGGGNKEPLTEEAILKMSDKEIGERQAEIKAFYAAQKK